LLLQLERFLNFTLLFRVSNVTKVEASFAVKYVELKQRLCFGCIPTVPYLYDFRYDMTLPQHLRCFTAGAVYARFLTYGVEVLQFTKRYSEAVDQLRRLLSQTVYHVDYRGRWYDRLALDVDYHLKRPLEVNCLSYLQ
jgi:hypothetical protein